MPTSVRVPSRGGRVAAWLFDAGPGSPGLVIAHGSGAGLREQHDEEARMLHVAGLTVLNPSKDRTGYGLLHRDLDALADDLAGQVAWLRERGHGPVGLLGFSEGAWVATIAAARPGVADAVVLLSAPIVSYADQTAHEWVGWLPRQVPGRARARDAAARLVGRLAPVQTRDVTVDLAAVQVPILAAWGERDPLVDVPRAQTLMDALAPHASQVVVPETGHGLRVGRERWMSQAVGILTRASRPTPPPRRPDRPTPSPPARGRRPGTSHRAGPDDGR